MRCACRVRKRTPCAERRTTSHPKSSSKLVRLNALFECRLSTPGHRCLSVAGHSFQADFWALGVTIYEMLTGKTPFATRGGGFATYRKVRRPQRSSLRGGQTGGFTRCVQVMKGVFECPDDMSPGAASLIRGLCTKDVSKRLGRLANGADDLRNHPWYTDAQFDWVSVHPSRQPAASR